jgi:hypothetical protein
LDLWQVEQIIVLATHDPGQATLGDIGDGCSIPRQSIPPDDPSIERNMLTPQIPGDDLGCAKEFAAVVSIARSRETSHPVVRVGLEDRCPCANHLPAFAPQISWSADLLQASMGHRKIGCVR